MRILRVILAFLIGIQSVNSYAWNALGHRVVANIAYDYLELSVRKKVDKMVLDLSKEYPDITYFNQIAPWPDTLRGQKIELYTRWHYINTPFSKDGTPLKDIVDTDNIVWAIESLKVILKNPKANAFERARSLAFLVHLVGDIHQPLHTVGYISAKYPEGDQGGNLYIIKYPAVKPQSMTLHRLWDQGIDSLTGDTSSENIKIITQAIVSMYPADYFGSKINNLEPVSWAEEGLEVASTFVYSTPENSVPNTMYLDRGRTMVEQKIALSGYRLANMLNQLLR
jgi:S1/P1 nuclease